MKACLGLVAVATTALMPAMAFVGPVSSPPSRANVIMRAEERGASRRDLVKTSGMLLPLVGILPFLQASPARAGEVTLPSGVKYTVLESGNGPQPQIGELAAIRFKGSYNNVVFDDVYKSREPLYYRVGGGTLLKGIDDSVQMMKVGDHWKLTIPGEMAFGAKGRSASPGKPRIPAMATVEYELSLVGLPGRETELIDLQDFDENAPASDDSANGLF